MEQIIYEISYFAENYPILLGLLFFLPAYVAFAKQSILSHFLLLLGIIACIFQSFYMISIPVLFIFLIVTFFLKQPKHEGIPQRNYGFIKTWIIHPIEAFLGYSFMLVIKLIPVKFASSIGSCLGMIAGKILYKRNKLAYKNVNIAFPKMKKEEQQKIVKGMWKNFGRMVFEIPHLRFFYRNEKYLQVENEKYLTNLPNHRFVAVFAHFNSLGMISLPFTKKGFPVGVIYRFPNNPVTLDLLQKGFGKGVSGKGIDVEFLPKSKMGIKKSLDFLKRGLPVAIAPDQYFTQGKPLTFFGKKAMTSTVAVKLANHFDCPILPVQIVRVKGIKHKIVLHKPMYFKGSSEKEINEGMQKVNDLIESWVRENPDQWLWIHHRWGKNA